MERKAYESIACAMHESEKPPLQELSRRVRDVAGRLGGPGGTAGRLGAPGGTAAWGELPFFAGVLKEGGLWATGSIAGALSYALLRRRVTERWPSLPNRNQASDLESQESPSPSGFFLEPAPQLQGGTLPSDPPPSPPASLITVPPSSSRLTALKIGTL